MLLKRFEELWVAPPGQPYMMVVNTSAVAGYDGKMLFGTGAGTLSLARQLYPALPAMMYKRIKEEHPEFRLFGMGEDYGFLPIINPPHGLGIFQIKRHWGEAGRLETIQKSAEMLCEYAAQHPEIHFRMSFPGIGVGRWGSSEPLNKTETRNLKEEVRSVLACMPDNVVVVQWNM